MKHYLLALSLLAASAAMAQHPNAPFNRKQKTTTPTPGLTERLNAEERGGPSQRANRQATLTAGKMTIDALPLRVVRDATTGQPIFIERKTPARQANQPANRQRARLSAEAASSTTLQFVRQVGSLLKLANPDAKFVVAHTEADELGQTHVRLTQRHRGVPVLGADLVAHLTDGEVTLLNGRYKTIPEDLSVEPALTLEQASTLALTDVKKGSVVRSFGANLFSMKQSEGSLCVFPREKGEARLAYQLTIRPNLVERWEYVIDAQTGAVLQKYDHTCTLAGPDVAAGPKPASGKDLNGMTRSFQTFQQGSGYYLIDASRAMFDATKSTMPDKPVGALMTLDANNTKNNASLAVSQITSTNNTNWTSNAVSAHYNAGLAYDYYKNTFNRNSLDGAGGTIISVINITDSDGSSMDNAFWNGVFMGYGNGNKLFKSLAGGLDVAGHEMTHGVIRKSANLEYMGQSGAMNEAFADIFGAMIDRANWTIGEAVVQPGAYKSGALRDLSNPNQGGKSLSDRGYQPATMAQYANLTEDEDNGGVHINSGIINFTYFKFATAIGKEKAEKVFYRALTTYLVRTSQFVDLRLAVIKSAGDLFGATSAEAAAAKAAFDATGIVEGSTPNPTQPELPVATGEDLMLLTEVGKSQLYSTKMAVSPATFDQKTTSALTHRPSVTDDGQTAYYVSSDKRIRSVNLTGAPKEFIVSDETIWDNVAISKDGTKLAALTADRDTSIYVYSFTKKKWARFKLYTPTYTEGVQNNNVLYADSFEWDFTGQHLIYDAYNAGGAVSDYWDVNVIDVWDNKTDSFGNGHTEALFPNLDEGESVGNPSFSKNSPNVIAFDYVNATDETYYIALADLKTGKAALVYQNNTIGFPNYSRLDDKLVFNRLDNDGNEAVSGILVGTDKLSVSGEAVLLYNGAKWPVWYTQTKRDLPTKVAQTITFAPIADQSMSQTSLALKATSTSKLTVGFRVKSGPATLTGTALKLTGVGTVVVQAFQNGNEQYSAADVVERTFKVVAKSLTGNGLVGSEPTWTDLVKVYPNPVSTRLTVELPDYQTLGAVVLRNVSGAAVQTPVLDSRSNGTALDVSQLPAGMYILQIQTDAGIINRKIVKE